MRPRSLGLLRLALAVGGLAISGYLTLLHYVSSVPLVCGQGSLVDCHTVLNSPSSMVLGLPVAVWGLAWFVGALALAVAAVRTGGLGAPPVHRALLAWDLVGTATVLWLVWQELAVIGKICAWCTAVHAVVLALLVVEVRAHGREEPQEELETP